MQLVQALRLGEIPRLALVGSGGKTTALFKLAGELSARSKPQHCTVLVSASTHLAVDQVQFGDHYYCATSPEQIEDICSRLPTGVVLFTGSQAEPERVAGLDFPALLALKRIADDRGLPLLIEADGSRQKPLKAPADHEPVIPPWIEQVVVVAGLSGLGKPLGQAWVHRPERFAELTGLQVGETVTPEALMGELTHPAGGLKGIPPGARRLALLNQADSEALQGMALGMAALLLRAYQAVVVAALAPEESSSGEPETSVLAVHEGVAGIILAAGAASRMGVPKQLLLWRGEPFVRHVGRAALQAGLHPVVLVSGAESEAVRQAVQDMPIQVVQNNAWQFGQSTSVRAGLQALPADTGAAVFLLADQPLVSVELLRSLVALHARELHPIVAPLMDGQRANPVLFDRQTFPDLLRLSGDTGGRALFSRYQPGWLTWHDRSVMVDIDTPQDYERFIENDRSEIGDHP
ncbi:MAG: putative selenium-dependent hydroxylase accessory protein YqeC [Anaerolineales bacterium]|nr:putative selenium-dependent hydroxylase accessory protein YqeC [Anaerolineales bacterium]